MVTAWTLRLAMDTSSPTFRTTTAITPKPMSPWLLHIQATLTFMCA